MKYQIVETTEGFTVLKEAQGWWCKGWTGGWETTGCPYYLTVGGAKQWIEKDKYNSQLPRVIEVVE